MDQCGIQCLEADIADERTLHEPMDMVDVVYSLASPPPGRSAGEYAEFNEKGLRNLLKEAGEHGVKTFVHLSTLDVFGFGQGNAIGAEAAPRPTDEYQRSKLEGERIVAEFGKGHPEIQVRIVRAAKAVGPRDTLLATPLLKMVERGKVVLPPGSSSVMSFTHPKDVAQALLKASGSVGDWTPYQVKSFDASAEDLARAILRSEGGSAEVRQQSMFSGRSIVPQYAAEQIRAGLRLEEAVTAGKLGFAPAYDLEKVASEISAWHRKEPWVTKDQA
jgi:nucleoside-diphosphate-sugar epimerase